MILWGLGQIAINYGAPVDFPTYVYAGSTNWPRWVMIINDVRLEGGYEGIQEELRGWVNVLKIHCIHVHTCMKLSNTK